MIELVELIIITRLNIHFLKIFYHHNTKLKNKKYGNNFEEDTNKGFEILAIYSIVLTKI